MEKWIEEVLFRGRPPSGPESDQPPRLHVVIGVQADDPIFPDEKVRRTFGPMSMATATEKFEYTPKSLVAEINAQLDQARQAAENALQVAEEQAAQKVQEAQTAQREAEERATIAEARLTAALDELAKRE